MGYSVYKDEFEVWDDDYMTETTRSIKTETHDNVIYSDPVTGEKKDGFVDTTEKFTIRFGLYKEIDAEKGLVSGWANVSKNADGSIPLDWQGDVIAPATLEDAAIDFMLNYRESGECHQGDAVGAVVESIVLTKEKQAAMGIPEGCVPEGWFITVKLFDKEAFEKVKSGEYQMFSIQGTGERVAV